MYVAFVQLPYTTSDAAITRALPAPRRERASQLGPIEPRTPRKVARSGNPNPILSLTLTLTLSPAVSLTLTLNPNPSRARRRGGAAGCCAVISPPYLPHISHTSPLHLP